MRTSFCCVVSFPRVVDSRTLIPVLLRFFRCSRRRLRKEALRYIPLWQFLYNSREPVVLVSFIRDPKQTGDLRVGTKS